MPRCRAFLLSSPSGIESKVSANQSHCQAGALESPSRTFFRSWCTPVRPPSEPGSPPQNTACRRWIRMLQPHGHTCDQGIPKCTLDIYLCFCGNTRESPMPFWPHLRRHPPLAYWQPLAFSASPMAPPQSISLPPSPANQVPNSSMPFSTSIAL